MVPESGHPLRPMVKWNNAQLLWQVLSQYGIILFHTWPDALYFANYATQPRHGAPHFYPQEIR
jgi:hypothetical protein